MDSIMQIVDPDSIKMELTLTMTLGDWKELREQLQE